MAGLSEHSNEPSGSVEHTISQLADELLVS